MDEHVYSSRAIKEYKKRAEDKQQKNLSGAHAEFAVMAYSAQAQRALSDAPTITTLRTSLQNTAGQFLLRPNADGTMTAGVFGFDEWGRMVAL